MEQKDFLEKLDQPRIVEAIRNAEQATSGEIRVHVQPKARGGEIRFVVLGDKGIDEKVPAGFWDDIAAKLTIRFRNGEFTEGIVDAITAAGEHLRTYFPRADDDVNELADD